MFIASKYEDIYPLKMRMVHEKIAHKKLSIERIKQQEMDIMKVIGYRVAVPTALDFLKYYLKIVLEIGYRKEEGNTEKVLVQKMSYYLAKMAVHDYDL